MNELKSSQLQLRVSPREKREIQRRAESAGLSMSEWVVSQLLPKQHETFQDLVRNLNHESSEAPNASSYALAALNDFLAKLSAQDFKRALTDPSVVPHSEFHRVYLAAMIEHAAVQKGAEVPAWVLSSGPLGVPYFATELTSLRLHLLMHSPPAFRRRNLFVDASVGDRV